MRRLTPAVVTLIMIVVVGGLVAAYVAKGLLAKDEAPAPPSTRNVPMAIADIEPGTLITEDHIGMGPVSISNIERDMLLADRVIVGRVARVKIPAATAIRAAQLYQPGEFPDLSVENGEMRAVTISIANSASMVEGLIKPNQYVDVHLTMNGSDERFRGGMTMKLFRGVRVIAINRSYSPSNVDRAGNTVTLELTKEQANVMILAEKKGDIALTYNPEGRGNGGIAVASDDRTTLEEILGLAPVEKPAPPFASEVYREGERSVLQFRDGRRVDSRFGNDDPDDEPDDPVVPDSPSSSYDSVTASRPRPGTDASVNSTNRQPLRL